MLPFSDFVTIYWNKLRRSGVPWNAASVADDTGMSVGDAGAYFTYCQSHPGLSDAQLIALSPIVQPTPFGLRLMDGAVATAPTSQLDLTLDKITLRQLLVALGK